MRFATALLFSLITIQASDLQAWRTTIEQADRLHERGELRQAAVLLESAVRQAREGAIPEALALSNIRLASVYVDLGEYRRAEPLYLEALRALSDQPGEELTRSIAHAGLAATYSHLGEWSRAEKFAQAGLDSRTVAAGKESRELTGPLVVLAGIYQAQRRDHEAEESLRRALHLMEHETLAEEPARAVALANLALLLRSQDRLDEAISSANQAIQIWERRPPDPRKAQPLTILASLYGRQGRWNFALNAIERGAAHR